jgi:2-oxoglutarate ferredoxin oxidoreductase subunit delta
MAKLKGAIEVDINRCKGCDICVTSCPFDVLRMSKEVNEKGYTYSYMLNPDNCTGCASCGLFVPMGVSGSIRLRYKKSTYEERIGLA